jgi:hypothetical protein
MNRHQHFSSVSTPQQLASIITSSTSMAQQTNNNGGGDHGQHQQHKRQRQSSDNGENDDVSSTSPLDVCGQSPSPQPASFSLLHSNSQHQLNGRLAILLKREVEANNIGGGTESSSHPNSTDFGVINMGGGNNSSGQSAATYSASPTASSRGSSLCGDGPSEKNNMCSGNNTVSSPVFTTDGAKFELPIPQPPPVELDISYICETASRLLFFSAHWMKKNVKGMAEQYDFLLFS